MGKSNRVKNEKAVSTLATPVKKAGDKKSMPTWVGTLIIVVVLVALVALVVLSTLNSRGVFNRVTVARSENYKINSAMMTYMLYQNYNNYGSAYAQYGITGTGGTKLDTTLPLRDQVYSAETVDGVTVTKTWFDFFLDSAMEAMENNVALCEYAHDNDIALDNAEKTEIDVQMNKLRTNVQENGFGDLDDYFTYTCGKGVLEKDVRRVVEIQTLAEKVSEVLNEGFYNAIGDEAVSAEYEANKATYDVYADYITYTFTATFTASAVTDAAQKKENNEKNAATYEEQKALYAAYAETLSKCTTKEQFETELAKALEEIFYNEEYKEAVAALAEGATMTEEKDAECRAAAAERVTEALADANVTNGAISGLSSDAQNWIKSSDRKVGDVKKFESVKNASSGSGDSLTYASATSTYTVFFLTGTLHPDAGVVRSVGHILFTTDSFKTIVDPTTLAEPYATLAQRVKNKGLGISDETMAAELVLLMKEEGAITEKQKADGTTYYEISEEKFNLYGLQYTEDGNVFYDDVTKGQMVEEFEDWMFSADRVVGEMSTNAVMTKYGYHIMYYKGNERASLAHTIKTKLASTQLTAKQEEISATEAYTLKFSESNAKWNKVHDPVAVSASH